MKLLVTGASGYLGRCLCRRATAAHQVLAGYHRHRSALTAGEPVRLDLLRPREAAATVRDLAPDAIIHAAAVNRGGGEGEMEAVNVEGSRAVAKMASEIGARLVHMSTDVVHDGRNAPYRDDTPASPIGLYARTKAETEKAVVAAAPAATLVRTSLVYGLDSIDHGTASFVDRLAAGEPVRLFADAVRQPVWVETLATALLRLLEVDFAGYLNVAGSQAMSRDDFGRRMLDWWDIPGRERVETVRVEELGLDVPRDLRLRLDRAREVLGIELPGVEEVLALNLGAQPCAPTAGPQQV